MVFGERLMALRTSNNLTREALAERLHMSKYTLRNYELSVNEPGSKFLKQVSDFFDVSIDYLMGVTDEKEKVMPYNLKASEYAHIEKYRSLDDCGRETIDIVLERETTRVQSLVAKDNEISKLKEQIEELNVPKRIFAYYGKIAAAGKSYGFDNVIAGIKEYPINDVNEKADYTIGVSGDSMEPAFYDGDIVYVKKVHHLNIGDIGIFQKENGIYIKEVGENGLISHNDQYKPMVNGGDVICLGKVLGKAE